MKPKLVYLIAGILICAGIAYWFYAQIPKCPIPLSPGERPAYMNIPPEAFSKLPPYPAQLEACRDLPLSQLALCPQCYLQPEILGSIWEQYGDPKWKSYAERIHFAGFGANPGRMRYIYSPGTELEIYTMVRAAFGVRNPQKLILKPSTPPGFKVEIQPSELELGATYPVFQPNWIYIVKIAISSQEGVELPAQIKIYAEAQAVGGVIPRSELATIELVAG